MQMVLTVGHHLALTYSRHADGIDCGTQPCFNLLKRHAGGNRHNPNWSFRWRWPISPCTSCWTNTDWWSLVFWMLTPSSRPSWMPLKLCQRSRSTWLQTSSWSGQLTTRLLHSSEMKGPELVKRQKVQWCVKYWWKITNCSQHPPWLYVKCCHSQVALPLKKKKKKKKAPKLACQKNSNSMLHRIRWYHYYLVSLWSMHACQSWVG